VELSRPYDGVRQDTVGHTGSATQLTAQPPRSIGQRRDASNTLADRSAGGIGWSRTLGSAGERTDTVLTQSRDTAQGVDANASKEHLYGVARELGIEGRSRMTKAELIKAIGNGNARQTHGAR
jgi:hypothetical protein